MRRIQQSLHTKTALLFPRWLSVTPHSVANESRISQTPSALAPVSFVATQLVVIPEPKAFDWGFYTFLFYASAVAFWLYDTNIRERKIIGQHISESEFIISLSDLKEMGKKPKGDLSGAIVVDVKTGEKYLKKGALDYDALVIEVLYSNFLALLRPGIQPIAKIAQEKLEDGKSRFYSLSRMVENAVDIEQFIRENYDWVQKLSSKPVRGLDSSLAIDFMLAKHRDMKLANYLIIDQNDHYEIASIDHEFANRGMTTNEFFNEQERDKYFLDKLVRGVRDLFPRSDENHAGLAGDPRVKDFFKIVATQMSIENVSTLYKQVAELNYDKLIDLTEVLHKCGFLDQTALHKYQTSLFAIRDGAQLAIYNISKKQSTSSVTCFTP